MCTWDELISAHYAKIYQFAFRYLGNAAEAEDVTQEVFLRAYELRGESLGRSQLRTWLYTVARNRCIDHHRSLRRWAALLPALSGTRPSVSSAEGSDLVQKLVSGLPRKQREVFILRHWHGFSTKDTAEVVGVTEGTVKSQLTRAVERLKKSLKREDF